MKKDIFLLHDKKYFFHIVIVVNARDDVSQCDLDLQSFSPNKLVSTKLRAIVFVEQLLAFVSKVYLQYF